MTIANDNSLPMSAASEIAELHVWFDKLGVPRTARSERSAGSRSTSIMAAVKEGRTVYNNIEKTMLFLLPINVAQALVIAVANFFAFTMPTVGCARSVSICFRAVRRRTRSGCNAARQSPT
jgi:hypothetical protein